MKTLCKGIALSALAVTLVTGAAIAQEHHDNHTYVRHTEWKKGAKISHDDWNRGDQVDYKQAHLSAPRRGYEWREVDGNYVMAAVATGVIASVIAESAAH